MVGTVARLVGGLIIAHRNMSQELSDMDAAIAALPEGPDSARVVTTWEKFRTHIVHNTQGLDPFLDTEKQ